MEKQRRNVNPVVRRKRKLRKKRRRANTNFRLIRGLNRSEKKKLRGIPSPSFLRYLAFKGSLVEEMESKPKLVRRVDKKTHGNYRAILRAKKVRRTEMKILNGRRDRKKELEVRIARQREKSRLRAENKRMRKVRAREIQKEALKKRRKAS